MNSPHLLYSPNSGESFYFRDRIPTDLLEHFGGVKELESPSSVQLNLVQLEPVKFLKKQFQESLKI